MPRVRNPLFSGDVRGAFGKKIIFTRGGVARIYFKPTNPSSAAQQAVRHLFKELYVARLTREQADLLYAAIGHLHDDRYSQLGHLHDDRYSRLGHGHTGSKVVYGMHGQGGNVPGNSTRYLVPFINGIQTVAHSVAIPGGTIKNLFVRQAGSMPGDGNMTVEIWSGPQSMMVATGVKVTFVASSGAQDRMDVTNTFVHADGHHVHVRATKSGASASSTIGGVVFEVHYGLT